MFARKQENGNAVWGEQFVRLGCETRRLAHSQIRKWRPIAAKDRTRELQSRCLKTEVVLSRM